jgi:FAD/FMN-containing dehydrogenase
VKRSMPDWNSLRDSVAGNVMLPGSPEHDSARKPVLANFHTVRPRAVVLCETPEDVSEVILFARRHGLHVTPRSRRALLRR